MELEDILDDYDDIVSDFLSTNYQMFPSRLDQFIAFLDETPRIQKVLSQDLPKVDFDLWYEDAKTTVGGMVGSGTLMWPVDRLENLAMRFSLLRHIQEGKEDIPNFCTKFMYSDNNFNVMVSDFTDQIVEPTSRDIRKLIIRASKETNSQAEDGAAEAIPSGEVLVPLNDQMSASFEDARKTLAEVLATLEGQNDPSDLDLSKTELRIVMGHLRACSEMLQDHMISRGLLNDTVREVSSLKDKLGLFAAIVNAFSAIVRFFV